MATSCRVASYYDLRRLPARRDIFRGTAVWDIFALARFNPDEQILAPSVTRPVSSSPGGMTVDRSPAIASFPVPGDSISVEPWFLNIGFAHFGEPPKLGIATSGKTTCLLFVRTQLRSRLRREQTRVRVVIQ